MVCTNYRPDHNGECLNCDEPADAHLPEGQPFDPVELGRIARWQYTENFVEAETRKPVLSLLVRFMDGGTLHVGGVMGEQLLLDVRPAPGALVTGDARLQVKRQLLVEHQLENPKLYEAARDACHSLGLPWTDPRSGVTYPAPTKEERATRLDALRNGVIERREKFKTADRVDNSLAHAGQPMFYQCPLCLDPQGIQVPEAWVTRPDLCPDCAAFLKALNEA